MNSKQKQTPIKQNGKSKKPVIKRIKQSPRNKLLKAPFLSALVSPFHPDSMGIRVPDPFPFPTATYHLHQTHVVGNAAGTGSVAFMPNPILSAIDLGGVNDATKASLNTTSFTRYATNPAITAYQLYGATGPSTLAGLLADYRIVSWGIKISNLQPELSATGKIIVAMIPHGDTIPSYSELVQTGVPVTSATVFPIFGTTIAALSSSAILQLPTAQEFAVQDFLHGDLEVSGMYTNTSFWQFKTCASNPVSSLTTSSGDSFSALQATGVPNAWGYKDLTRMIGACSVVMYFEGMPATFNSIQVETIYHLEGSPQINSNTNITPVPSCAAQTSVGSNLAVENSMAVASRPSNVFTWITKGADFLQNTANVAGNIAVGSAKVIDLAYKVASLAAIGASYA